MADPIDIHVGSRIRMRRVLLGLSQQSLGKVLGVTFQQVQKYEGGANRVGASRLYRVAQALEVSPQYFFEDMPPEASRSQSRSAKRKESSPAGDLIDERESLYLNRIYSSISDPLVRKRIVELIKVVAPQNGAPS